MRTILFVSPTGTLDNGAEVSIFNLMKFLTDEGYKVINVAPIYQNLTENEYSRQFTEYGIDCILINSQRWWWEEAPGHLFGTSEGRANSYRETIREIADLIEINKVDIVISNTVNVFQGALAAALMGKPHFWLIHEFPENEFAYYGDKLDFINDYSTEIFAVRGQLSNKVTELFPNRKIKSFVPYTEISAAKPNIGSAQRIVSIGRLTERKNQLELIRAFAKVNRPDLELVFIGGWDEDYKNKCTNYIKENKLEKITFLGNKEKPWNEITDKDICVFPSAMETFGLVYVEALLNGVPVIFSDNPGHSSAYEMFKFGQMYQLGNTDLLANLMENSIDNFFEARKSAVDFSEKAKKIYELPIVYKEILEETLNHNHQQQNSIRHIKTLLATNEKKSKLAKLEFRIRQRVQRIIYRIFGK